MLAKAEGMLAAARQQRLDAAAAHAAEGGGWGGVSPHAAAVVHPAAETDKAAFPQSEACVSAAAEADLSTLPSSDSHSSRSRSPHRSRLTLRNMLPTQVERMRRRLPAMGIFDREMDVTELLSRSQLIVAQVAALQALNEVHADMLRGTTTWFSSLIDAIAWGSSSGVLSPYETQCLRALNRHADEVKHGFRI